MEILLLAKTGFWVGALPGLAYLGGHKARPYVSRQLYNTLVSTDFRSLGMSFVQAGIFPVPTRTLSIQVGIFPVPTRTLSIQAGMPFIQAGIFSILPGTLSIQAGMLSIRVGT
jgi:hypothetical protein